MQSLKHILETDFAKGMNNQVKSEFIQKGQVYKALNCLVGDQKIKKGPGTDRIFKMVGASTTSADSYNISNKSGVSYINGAGAYLGQSFTGNGNRLKSVSLYLGKFNNPTSNCYVYIYAAAGTYGTDNVPTGDVLAISEPVNSSTFQNYDDPGLITFTFNDTRPGGKYQPALDNRPILGDGTKYCLEVITLTYSFENSVSVAHDTSSPSHGGNYFNSVGADATKDLCFTVTTEAEGGNVILGGISTDNEMYIACNEPGDHYCYIYRYTGTGEPVAVSGASLTKDLPVEFVDTGSAVYVFNGTDVVGKLVAAVYTTVAAIPKGKWATWLNNRLYTIGVTGNLDRLYFSGANTPETFGDSDYIDIIPSQRSRTTGLNSLSSNLIIGKDDKIISFSGFTADSFAVKNLVDNLPNFGSKSHRAMVNIGDDLIYLSYSGHTPHFRSVKWTQEGIINDGGVISKDIEATMATLNTARLDLACGGFDGRYAYWSVPTGSSLVNDLTLIYDVFEKGWTIHDTMPASVYFKSSVINAEDKMYFGCTDSTSSLFSIDHDIYSRNDEAISMELISRTYRQQATRKTKNKYLYLITGDSTGGYVKVEASPDGFTWEDQGTITPYSGGSVFPFTFPFNFGSSQRKRERIELKTNPSYSYQLRFTESSTSAVSINEWDLYYYERKLRDVS